MVGILADKDTNMKWRLM